MKKTKERKLINFIIFASPTTHVLSNMKKKKEKKWKRRIIKDGRKESVLTLFSPILHVANLNQTSQELRVEIEFD